MLALKAVLLSKSRYAPLYLNIFLKRLIIDWLLVAQRNNQAKVAPLAIKCLQQYLSKIFCPCVEVPFEQRERTYTVEYIYLDLYIIFYGPQLNHIMVVKSSLSLCTSSNGGDQASSSLGQISSRVT